ncbi:hypothetical protein EB613_14350 [Escherichia coli]|nr:hypothetical protein [Escherichia coli]EFO0354407.1 hypothetical protein [Escherichia coli]
MRRERLIRPTYGGFVGLIRRVSVASGTVHQMPDAAWTPYPAYIRATRRPDKARQRRIRHRAPNAGCGVNALSGLHTGDS